jgi:hypothetical protein
MYVWTEGENHRISIQGSIAYCQVWDPPGIDGRRRTELAADLSSAGRRMIERGLRPLGLVLDLRRTQEPQDAPTRLALAALLAAWERARLPVAILTGSTSRSRTSLARLIEVHAPRQGRILDKLLTAEAWIQAGGAESRVL